MEKNTRGQDKTEGWEIGSGTKKEKSEEKEGRGEGSRRRKGGAAGGGGGRGAGVGEGRGGRGAGVGEGRGGEGEGVGGRGCAVGKRGGRGGRQIRHGSRAGGSKTVAKNGWKPAFVGLQGEGLGRGLVSINHQNARGLWPRRIIKARISLARPQGFEDRDMVALSGAHTVGSLARPYTRGDFRLIGLL